MASPACASFGGGAAPAEAQTCPLCFEPFETQKAAAAAAGVQSDRRPRVLACGHSFCGACLHADMQQRRCCAMCKKGIAYPDAVAVPINFSLIAAIERAAESAAQMAVLQRQVADAQEQSRPKCAECGALPTLFCAECDDHGLLCAAHSQHVHALQRNKAHAPFIVPFAEKAAAIAAKVQREAQTKCAKHPKQDVELYCTDCNVPVCLMCVHGNKHSGHEKIEIDEAAAKVRDEQLSRHRKMMWPEGPFRRPSNLTAQLQQMKEELAKSSRQAHRNINVLIAEVKAATEQRGAELKQQLMQKREAADVVIAEMLAASSAAAAAETQLTESLPKADGGNHHETLVKEPQIAQRFIELEAQLRDLYAMAARSSMGRGCVTALKLSDGKQVFLNSLSQLSSVDPEVVVLGGSTVAGSNELRSSPEELASLVILQSHILPGAKHADLLRFFGRTQVPRKLLYRASRDGFELKDWKARCLGKGPTMTLVKAAESGFVFGAYTHSSWPALEGGGKTVDLSNQSFLFSLINKAGQAPIRLSQRDLTKPAVHLFSSVGPDFGNFSLMDQGRAACAPEGNFSWGLGSADGNYSWYQPDDPALCDTTFGLACAGYFTCEEIEVYASGDSDCKEIGAAAAANGLKRSLARGDGSSSSSTADPHSTAHKKQKVGQ